MHWPEIEEYVQDVLKLITKDTKRTESFLKGIALQADLLHNSAVSLCSY